MKAQDLRAKSVDELNQLLLEKLREQFKLRLQMTTRQLTQSHLLKEVRKDIARINTLLTEKAGN